MNTITKYQARDKREFDSEDKCKKHEELLDDCDKIYELLPPDGFVDYNGENYVQLSESIVDEAKNRYTELCIKWFNEAYPHPRKLDDSNSPVYGLCLTLFYFIGPEYRLWGQQYFANNPNPDAVEIPWPA